MNKLLIVYSTIIFYGIFLSCSNVLAADTSNYQFKYDNKGLSHYYSKIENSECYTTVIIRESSSCLSLSYGGDCSCNNKKRERTVDIAHSLDDIIDYYQLEKTVRSMATLSISINCIVSHAPLILYINDSKEWPNNFYNFFRKKTNSYEKSYSLYVEYLRKTIIHSQIYDPFVSVMLKNGCRMSLKEVYVDGIPFNNRQLTRRMLIGWGVLSKEKANKEIYPSLKGGIEFDLFWGQ